MTFAGLSREQAMAKLRLILGPEAQSLALSGVCPLCGIGPFESLTSHIARKHQLKLRWLKEALDLPWGAALMADRLRQRLSETSKSKPPEHMQMMRDLNRPSSAVSPAGRVAKGASGRRVRAAADLTLTEDARALLAEAQRAVEESHRVALEKRAERDALIWAAFRAGASRTAIARAAGLSPPQIHHIIAKMAG